MKSVILLLGLLIVISCSKIIQDQKVDKSKLLGADYLLFQDTPAWELAKAVWDNDITKIDEEIEKNPQIINYQDPKYGNTLLHMSIYNDDYAGFKELLRLGANPNVADSFHCSTPLIEACESFEDRTKYVAELIKYKANVNYVECNSGKEEQKTNNTPLMRASFTGNLDVVKLLVNNGANINYNDNTQGGVAIGSAVLASNYNIVLYLLQKGADCNVILYKRYNPDETETPVYLKDLLQEDELKSSKEYTEIINILKEKNCL
ncbi:MULTISPECIES: ankyrin repeat domain-containing protein [Chryseobacterium]|uniref:Ankyrin repeat domain-containing protein n=1 Tax=Chryseobacterium endophyticum TaxID=1854762 RepID=A0AAU6WMX5_9FLAO